MDLKKRAAADTFEMKVIDPSTGETMIDDESGKECSVTLSGPGTKQFAGAKSRASNRSIKRLRARGKADTTPEEDIEATAAFLTDITAGFNNFTYGDGEPGPDMFRACYRDTAMGWLTDQVNAAGGDWGNFTQTSPTN
jgi:hypothetical protein